MLKLGDPVLLNIRIPETEWILENIVVQARTAKGWKGRLTLNSGKKKEGHNWTASGKKGQWDIVGEGAIMRSGERVPSARTYPFSFINLVNQRVRIEIGKFIDSNRLVIPERKPGTGVRIPLADFERKEGPVERPVRIVPAVSHVRTLPVVKPSFPKPTQPVVQIKAPVLPPQPPSGNGNGSTGGGRIPAMLEIRLIPIEEIEPFEGQPREEFTEADLNEIRKSIEQEDQKQLITVTSWTGKPGKKWRLVDGERRYRGFKSLGLKKIWALIGKKYDSDASQFWDSFTMNWNRRGHTHLENSRAIARAFKDGKNVAQIMSATGMTNAWVYQHLHVGQRLAPELLDLMKLSVPKRHRMRFGWAYLLARIPEQADQIRIWEAAKSESTPALLELKLKELAAPILDESPYKGRKRKPSDNAAKLVRIIRTAAIDMRFAVKATDADLLALVGSAKNGNTLKQVIDHVKANADLWRAFYARLGELV